MKNNYTKINWNLEGGQKKKAKPVAAVKRRAGNVTTNYSMMLQIYLINKEEAANKRGPKLITAEPKKAGTVAKTFAFMAGIAPLITRLFDFFSRESKASVSMMTE